MSFENCFDGYCVIHAPFATASRRRWFETELSRVGIRDFTIIEAKQVDSDDPRLKYYSANPSGDRVLSNLDAVLASIECAQSNGWRSVVVFEDDVIFRPGFPKMWKDVEKELNVRNWGLITPFRWPMESLLTVEKLLRKTTLVPIEHNKCCHCLIIRGDFYEPIRSALQICVSRGWPSDFFYGVLSSAYPGRLFATSKNLVGQAGGFASSIQRNFTSHRNFYAAFKCCRSTIELHLISLAYRFIKQLRDNVA